MYVSTTLCIVKAIVHVSQSIILIYHVSFSEKRSVVCAVFACLCWLHIQSVPVYIPVVVHVLFH